MKLQALAGKARDQRRTLGERPKFKNQEPGVGPLLPLARPCNNAGLANMRTNIMLSCIYDCHSTNAIGSRAQRVQPRATKRKNGFGEIEKITLRGHTLYSALQ